MNTIFQKQGHTKFSLVFDKNEENNHILQSASPFQLSEIELNGENIYTNKAHKGTLQIGDTLYWEDTQEGCVWGLKGQHPLKPYRGIVKSPNGIHRFTALPSTSYDLFYMLENGKNETRKIRFRLEYGLAQNITGGFVPYFRMWQKIGEKEELAATNHPSDKDEDNNKNVYCQQGMVISGDQEGMILFKADLSSTIEVIRQFYPDSYPGFALYFNLKTEPGYKKITGNAQLNHDSGLQVTVYTEEKKNNAPIPNLLTSENMKGLRNKLTYSHISSLLSNDETPMSVTDLFILNAPQPDILNKDFSTLFTQVLIYLCKDKIFHYTPQNMDIYWYQWLGVNPSSLLSSIAGLLGLTCKDAEKFLNDLSKTNQEKEAINRLAKDFVLANLSNSFSASENEDVLKALNQLKTYKKEDTKNNIEHICQYYFEGKYAIEKAVYSLSSNPAITILQEKLMNQLYLTRVEGLRRYVESEKKKEWAKKLYEYCKENTANIAMQIYIPGGSKSYLKHLCMMLDLLDDSPNVPLENKSQNTSDKQDKCSYAGALYTHILNLLSTQLGDSLAITDDNIEACKNYLSIFFHNLAEIFFRNSQELAPDVSDAIKKVVQEYNLKTEAQLQTFYDTHLDEMLSIMSKDFCKNPITTGLIKNPFAKTVFGEVAVLGIYGMMFYMLLPTFKNFQQASAAEKSFAILASIRVVAGVGCDALRLSAIKTLSSPTAKLSEKIDAAKRLKFGGDDYHTIKDIYKSSGKSVDKSLLEEIKTTARYNASPQYKNDITITTKFFKIGTIALRGLNIALMAFALYEMGRKITDDFATGASSAIKGLDIAQEVCMGISVLCEGTAIVLDLAGMACEFIPVVGTFFMIGAMLASIIASVVESSKKKADIPEVAFSKDVLAPFLKTLPAPDAQWIAEHNKQKNYLNSLKALR